MVLFSDGGKTTPLGLGLQTSVCRATEKPHKHEFLCARSGKLIPRGGWMRLEGAENLNDNERFRKAITGKQKRKHKPTQNTYKQTHILQGRVEDLDSVLRHTIHFSHPQAIRNVSVCECVGSSRLLSFIRQPELPPLTLPFFAAVFPCGGGKSFNKSDLML